MFEIPVAAVNKAIPLAAHSKKNDQWLDRNVTFTVAVEEPEIETEHEVTTDNSMFKIIRSVLTKKGDKYYAKITLSGTGYDKVYCGTAASAAADSANWISYSGSYDYTNDNGEAKTGYVFEIPVAAVNKAIPLAAHSKKNDQWLDRNVTFTVANADSTPGDDPTATPTPSPAPVTEATPGKVNSSTSLKDGTYTPDKFSWSGGSGRVSISCSKVRVKDGKAYATISFSSSNYGYVKASGRKYYGSVVGGRSTFEIPVKLNSNNRIVGMTTAMSVDTEISYTIYVYIAGAMDFEEKASLNADAQIIGLDYVSTDKTENSKLYKVYRYEGGIAVIDVEGAGKYLIADGDAELPVGIEEEAMVVRQPVMKACASSESVLQLLQLICGENVELMAEPWDYTAPDYADLLMAGCDLIIVPEIFAEPGEDEQPLPEETAAAIADVRERLALLGIPMFVDRSADEETEAGRLEWIKVYGMILGCEDEANALYEKLVAELPEAQLAA